MASIVTLRLSGTVSRTASSSLIRCEAAVVPHRRIIPPHSLSPLFYRSISIPRRKQPFEDAAAAAPVTATAVAPAGASPATAAKTPLHTSSKNNSSLVADPHAPSNTPSPASEPPRMSPDAPLSVLPLSMIVRSLLTTTVSSSPVLLPPSLRLMSLLAHSSNSLFNPDQNPVLRWFLKKTFYAQFCAGEHPEEVRHTIRRLKDIGFTGVILGYAKETVLSKTEARDLASSVQGAKAADGIAREIAQWVDGTEATVKLAQPGDFVALKFTGAGRQALYSLSERLPPPPALAEAIDRVCACAAEHGVRLLFDAEQAALQPGIDDWTLAYMRRYNTEPGRAVIYGTYQAYLKSAPATLARHLQAALDGNFTLGVKLVRGAYLGSDPRHLIHDTKADTDAAYDAITESLLKRQWGDVFRKQGAEGTFPEASLVVASHNAESVRHARAIHDAGEAKIDVAFGQLQGMADEISCELVTARKGAALQTYKYLVWGSTGECMKYLLRRAYENRDAVQRTRAGRNAMWAELVRRAKQAVGLTS